MPIRKKRKFLRAAIGRVRIDRKCNPSAAECIIRLLLLKTQKTWRTGAKGVATLIHHSSCRHFCFSSSRLFSRIICHDRFHRVSSSPSLVRHEGCNSNRAKATKAKKESRRCVHPSLPLSASKGGLWRNQCKRECDARITRTHRIIMRQPTEAHRREQ